MPFTCRSWEMNLGSSIAREAEGQENNRIYANRSDCMAHRGLCNLPKGLPSQHATDACLEDDRPQHSNSYTKHGSIPTESSNFSDVSHDVAWQEGQNVCFPDLDRPALKRSFSRESSRSSFWSPYSSTLSVVSEDKPWDSSSSLPDSRFQDERSSLSSLSSSEESSSCSLEDDSEIQSSYKEPLDNMYSLEEALPRKRGLSAFFTGKSRSFSCLADVASVEDLAKSENPYSKKRKFISACIGNADKLRTHPMQMGVVGISKKSFHCSQHSHALSGGASVKGTKPRQLNSRRTMLMTPRSYSLSDLQGAGSRFSPPDE